MTLARRIALLHPALVSIVMLVASLAQRVVAMTTPSPLVHGIWATLSTAIFCGWPWAIYQVSAARLGPDAAPAWTPWIFAAPPILGFVAIAAGLPTDNSPMAILILGAMLFGAGRAAQALERADPARTAPPPPGRIPATLLLLMFSIVGAWVLRARIVRVAAPLEA